MRNCCNCIYAKCLIEESFNDLMMVPEQEPVIECWYPKELNNGEFQDMEDYFEQEAEIAFTCTCYQEISIYPTCTKCGDDNEGADFWDFGEEKLCQMCWESHCEDEWQAAMRAYEQAQPFYWFRAILFPILRRILFNKDL
jgi:hypothetical protein